MAKGLSEAVTDFKTDIPLNSLRGLLWLSLLHCSKILHHLTQQGSPKTDSLWNILVGLIYL